jgi:CHASE3 domain sensor protein
MAHGLGFSAPPGDDLSQPAFDKQRRWQSASGKGETIMNDIMAEGVSSSIAATRQTEETVVAAISSGGGQPREQAIRERAYQIWEAEGRSEGKELDHWLRAEAEVIAIGEEV